MSYDLLTDVSGYIPPSRVRMWWEAHGVTFGPSTFSGATQRYHQWGRWRASFIWEGLEAHEALPIETFLASHATLGTVFLIVDPAHVAPRVGFADASGQVKTTPAAGARQLATKWAGGLSGKQLFTAGDRFSIAATREYYTIAKDVTATDPSSVTLDLVQAIRVPPTVNAYLTTTKPSLRVTLDASCIPEIVAPLEYASIQADMTEDLATAVS